MVNVSKLPSPPLLLPLATGGSRYDSDLALSSSRRAMMRYYTATFTLLLTTNVENNCFLSGQSAPSSPDFVPASVSERPLLTLTTPQCYSPWRLTVQP